MEMQRPFSSISTPGTDSIFNEDNRYDKYPSREV